MFYNNYNNKPEVELTVERKYMAKRFQRLPPHFRPEYNTADMVRHRTTSVTQMSATKPKVESGSGQTL